MSLTRRAFLRNILVCGGVGAAVVGVSPGPMLEAVGLLEPEPQAIGLKDYTTVDPNGHHTFGEPTPLAAQVKRVDEAKRLSALEEFQLFVDSAGPAFLEARKGQSFGRTIPLMFS